MRNGHPLRLGLIEREGWLTVLSGNISNVIRIALTRTKKENKSA